MAGPGQVASRLGRGRALLIEGRPLPEAPFPPARVGPRRNRMEEGRKGTILFGIVPPDLVQFDRLIRYGRDVAEQQKPTIVCYVASFSSAACDI